MVRFSIQTCIVWPWITHALSDSTFHIFIIEQSMDGRKFNRGKLLNAGFDMARNDYDTFIFHDVDLLPGVRHALLAV